MLGYFKTIEFIGSIYIRDLQTNKRELNIVEEFENEELTEESRDETKYMKTLLTWHLIPISHRRY